MEEMLEPLRRIVTERDAQGKSFISEDGESPAAPQNPANPEFRKYNVWATGQLPVPFDEPDRFDEIKGPCPLPGGAVVHVIDFPPEPTEPGERERFLEARRRDLAKRLHTPGVRHYSDSRVVGMHETDSIDFAFVLSGEILAVLDKEETLMRTGDVMIQRGTTHAWSNRSGAPCRMAFVLVSARDRSER